MTFTYKKAKSFFIFSIPIILLFLLLMVSLVGVSEAGPLNFKDPITYGIYSVFLVILVFLVFVAIKVADMIVTKISIDEKGFYFKSLLKNVVIPWRDILQVRGIHLTHMPGGLAEYYTPKRPEDILIQTKSHGNLRIFNSLIAVKGETGIDLFTQELMKRTKWTDSDEDWKENIVHKRAISLKLMGIGMFLIGIFFQVINPLSNYEILRQIKNITGIHAMTIFCFVFGIYYFIAKPKKP